MRRSLILFLSSFALIACLSLIVILVLRQRANNALAQEVLGEWFPSDDISYGINLYKVGKGVMYNRAYAFGKKNAQGCAAFRWKIVGDRMLFGQSDEEGHVPNWETRTFRISSDGKELWFDNPPMKLDEKRLFRSAQTPVGNRSEYSGQ